MEILDLNRSPLTGALGTDFTTGAAGGFDVVVGTTTSIELSVWASTELLLNRLNTPIQLKLCSRSNCAKPTLRDRSHNERKGV